jgi:hypothetical protein
MDVSFTKEQQETLDIAQKYFLRETGGDEEKANELMAKLATVVQEDGAKIIRIDKILFLILVRGKGAVEVHTMAAEIVPQEMVKGFQKLVDFLKDIEVKLAYTFTEDRRFARIARQTKLPFKELKEVIDGKETYIYLMEF